MGPEHLTPAERRALVDFVAGVRARLGRRTERLVLFGSRARGEGHEESDLDVLVLVADRTRSDQLAVYDAAYDVWDAGGIDVSPLVRSPEAWADLLARERRLALDVEREGVPL